MPSALLREEETPKSRLVHLVLKGARKRYGKPDERVRCRLHRELRCIGTLGFASYFLVHRRAVESRSVVVAIRVRRAEAHPYH